MHRTSGVSPETSNIGLLDTPNSASPGTVGSELIPAYLSDIFDLRDWVLKQLQQFDDPLRQRRIVGADIANATITSSLIADGTITGSDIANSTITSTNIVDGTITGTDIASSTITSSNIVDGTITGTDISASTITSSNIVDGTITGTDIASSTITNSLIVDATLTGAKIADATITSAKVVSLVADKISTGSLVATISISSGLIRTGTSGPRTEITSSGPNLYTTDAHGGAGNAETLDWWRDGTSDTYPFSDIFGFWDSVTNYRSIRYQTRKLSDSTNFGQHRLSHLNTAGSEQVLFGVNYPPSTDTTSATVGLTDGGTNVVQFSGNASQAMALGTGRSCLNGPVVLRSALWYDNGGNFDSWVKAGSHSSNATGSNYPAGIVLPGKTYQNSVSFLSGFSTPPAVFATMERKDRTIAGRSYTTGPTVAYLVNDGALTTTGATLGASNLSTKATYIRFNWFAMGLGTG